MPQVFDRQKALQYLEDKIELNMALALSTSDDDNMEMISLADNELVDTASDSDIELLISFYSKVGQDPYELESCVSDLLELYYVMDGTRYFVERPVTNKSKDFVINFFDKLPVKLFLQMTCIDKPSFFELVNMIEDHPIFHNDSTASQAPIPRQLAVCLDRLGHDGNGACLNHLILTWGVSNGSLCNFTTHCFIALGTALQGFLKWPSQAERAKISAEYFARKGFLGCVGLIDGTLIPLSQCPKESRVLL